MKGAYRLATISGIPVYIHWTFGLLFFYVLYIGNSTGMDLQGMGLFSLFLLSLFFCVVLHEFGHAFAARQYGVSTQDIILSPIGGVARLNKLPEKPIQEFVVAIAGPLVNVAIALVLGIGLYFFADARFLPGGEEHRVFNDLSNFVPMLFLLNLVLVGFNLLPAFPMDGGRILRSLLSIPLGRPKATRIASWLGQGIAICFIGYSLYHSELMLGLIGLFVFFAASHEYRMVMLDHLLSDKTVADMMRRQFTRLSAAQPMHQAAFELQHSNERHFVVLDEAGNIVGVLTEQAIAEAIKNKQLDTSISSHTSRNFEAVVPQLGLKQLFQIMHKRKYSLLPVINEWGQMIAVVDTQGMDDFVKLQRKLK